MKLEVPLMLWVIPWIFLEPSYPAQISPMSPLTKALLLVIIEALIV